MAFYREEEVGRLIEQWMRWPGFHGGSAGASPLAWLDAYVPKKVGDYQASIPMMSGEAEDTQHALWQIDKPLRDALVAYYAPPYTIACKVRDMNRKRKNTYRIHITTFLRHVELGHITFISTYERNVAANREAAIKNSHAIRGKFRPLNTPEVRASSGLVENGQNDGAN